MPAALTTPPKNASSPPKNRVFRPPPTALCIFGGIYLFWYSDQIASEARVKEILSLSGEIELHGVKLQELQARLSARNIEAENLKKGLDTEGKPIKLDPNLAENRKRQLADTELQVNITQQQISATKKIVESDEKRRDLLRNEPKEQVAIAVATKLGSVLLLLFFVRVLVAIFRYYARLAVFFQARADILGNYHLTDNVEISEFSMLMSPDTVEFDKTPELPDPPAISLAKEVLGNKGKSD